MVPLQFSKHEDGTDAPRTACTHARNYKSSERPPTSQSDDVVIKYPAMLMKDRRLTVQQEIVDYVGMRTHPSLTSLIKVLVMPRVAVKLLCKYLIKNSQTSVSS